MKNIRLTGLILLTLLFSTTVFSQRHHRQRAKKVVVIKHSRFRPKNIVVFRPAWHPRWSCHRRWVFFPKYNFYWDNWRNHYVFYQGTVWVSQSTPPTQISNVDLTVEKYYELNEPDDDNDDIGLTNATHKEKYKEKEN